MLLFVFVFVTLQVHCSDKSRSQHKCFHFLCLHKSRSSGFQFVKPLSTNHEVQQDFQMSHRSSFWIFMFPIFTFQGVGGWDWSNFYLDWISPKGRKRYSWHLSRRLVASSVCPDEPTAWIEPCRPWDRTSWTQLPFICQFSFRLHEGFGWSCRFLQTDEMIFLHNALGTWFAWKWNDVDCSRLDT